MIRTYFLLISLASLFLQCQENQSTTNENYTKYMNRKFDIERFLEKAKPLRESSFISFQEGDYPLVSTYKNDTLVNLWKLFTNYDNNEFIYAELITPSPPELYKEYFNYNKKGELRTYIKSTIGGDVLLEQVEWDDNGQVKKHETPYKTYEKLPISLDSLYSILEQKKLYNPYYDDSYEPWEKEYFSSNQLSPSQKDTLRKLYQANRVDIDIKLGGTEKNPIWEVEKDYKINSFYSNFVSSILRIDANTGEILEERLAYLNRKVADK